MDAPVAATGPTSTVDIAVSNFDIRNNDKTPSGLWDAASDHRRVVFDTPFHRIRTGNVNTTESSTVRRVPKTRLADRSLQKHAQEFYAQEIPGLITNLQQARTTEQAMEAL